MEPPPGIAPGWPAYRAGASLKMLWGHRKWSARDDLHVQGCLILSQVGLLFPANHAPDRNGVVDWWSNGLMGAAAAKPARCNNPLIQ